MQFKVSPLLKIVTSFNEESNKWDAVLLIADKQVNHLRGEGHSPLEALRDLNHYIDGIHRDIENYLDQQGLRKSLCTIL